MLYPAARVLLHAGQYDEVEAIASALENQLQSQTRAYAGLLRGERAQLEGRLPDAIDDFRESLQRNDTWFGRYLLGRAYLEAGHHAEALAELELCFKRRGETSDVFIADTPTVRYFPPLHYWLARSREEVGARAAAAPELPELPGPARGGRHPRSSGRRRLATPRRPDLVAQSGCRHTG